MNEKEECQHENPTLDSDCEECRDRAEINVQSLGIEMQGWWIQMYQTAVQSGHEKPKAIANTFIHELSLKMKNNDFECAAQAALDYD